MSDIIPSAIKTAVGSLVARANELEHVEPAVSYWIRYWTVQKVVDAHKQDRSEEVDAFLVLILEQLEAMKMKYANLLEIENGAAGKQKVESFALTVFANADKEERAKVASKNTASKFLAAAVFLEACQAFGSPRKEIVDKRKYAKVQAMRIQTAIAAGKNPNLGKTSREPEVSNGDVTVAEQQELDALLQVSAGIPDTDANSLENGKKEILSVDAKEASGLEFETSTTELNSSESRTDHENSGNNPYFPSLSEGTKAVIVDEAHISKKVAHSPESLPTSPGVVIASTESQQEIARSPGPTLDSSAFIPDSGAIEAAQKHAKFAISALNYEDISTAVLELQKALKRLQG